MKIAAMNLALALVFSLASGLAHASDSIDYSDPNLAYETHDMSQAFNCESQIEGVHCLKETSPIIEQKQVTQTMYAILEDTRSTANIADSTAFTRQNRRPSSLVHGGL